MALLVVLGAGERRAEGSPATIVLLEPRDPSATAKETTLRAQAELRAAGFVVVVSTEEGDVTRTQLEKALADAGAVAAIAIDSRPGSTVADVWVSDRVTKKLSIRPVETKGSGDTPALLAIRAVELLRASLLELGDSPRVAEAAKPVPEEVERFAAPRSGAPAPERGTSAHAGFRVGVGVAGLFNVDHVAPAVAPAFRVGFGSSIGVGGRITFIGPSAGAGLNGALGTAILHQEVALAELTFAPPTRGPVYGLVTAGIGVLHVGASGELADAKRARSGGATSFLSTIGAGAGVGLGRHFALELEGFIGFAAPRIVVDMGTERVGSVGRPMLGATLGAVARF